AHLLLAQADVARRFAVLREDELAAPRVAGAGLPELAQLRVEFALVAAVEDEAGQRVIEAVRHAGEDRPPVARRAGLRTRVDHRVAFSEEHLVERSCGGVRFVARHLAEARHGVSFRRAAERGGAHRMRGSRPASSTARTQIAVNAAITAERRKGCAGSA